MRGCDLRGRDEESYRKGRRRKIRRQACETQHYTQLHKISPISADR